jgi:hypothetical protein
MRDILSQRIIITIKKRGIPLSTPPDWLSDFILEENLDCIPGFST